MSLDKIIKGKDHDELLYNICCELKNAPEYSPRGQKTKEIINAHLELEDPYARLITNPARKFSNKYVAAEILWYLSGERSIEGIKDYASMWEKVANVDGTANSAYGHQIFKMELPNYYGSQYSWVVESLMQDKDSRQALININLPEHKDITTKDFTCTETIQYLIRDDKLYCINNMRSNDGIYGTGNDIPFFTFLQEMLLEDLKTLYSDLKMGSYYHNAGSLHIYEKHYNMLDNIIDTYENLSPESCMMPQINYKFLHEYHNGFKEKSSELTKWLYNTKRGE